MEKYNILVVDNSPAPRTIADALDYRGHTVTVCKNLCDAEFYTCWDEPDKKTTPFDFIFLDLTMNNRDLPKEHREEATRTCAGWVFYKRILKEKNPDLYKRAIIFSAYGDRLKDFAETAEEYSAINVLSKTANDLVDTAEEIMKKILEKEKQEDEGIE